jgi:hypothetical protein
MEAHSLHELPRTLLDMKRRVAVPDPDASFGELEVGFRVFQVGFDHL